MLCKMPPSWETMKHGIMFLFCSAQYPRRYRKSLRLITFYGGTNSAFLTDPWKVRRAPLFFLYESPPPPLPPRRSRYLAVLSYKQVFRIFIILYCYIMLPRDRKLHYFFLEFSSRPTKVALSRVAEAILTVQWVDETLVCDHRGGWIEVRKSADPCFFSSPNPSIRQNFCSNPKSQPHPETEV